MERKQRRKKEKENTSKRDTDIDSDSEEKKRTISYIIVFIAVFAGSSHIFLSIFSKVLRCFHFIDSLDMLDKN